VKVVARTDRTHNPFDESHGVSRLRENLTSGSDGEGLETERWRTLPGHEEANLGNRQGQACQTPPRQSFTRQVFHRTLKSGCRIEDRRLAEAGNLQACLALDMVVAWRVLYLTRLERQTPDLRLPSQKRRHPRRAAASECGHADGGSNRRLPRT